MNILKAWYKRNHCALWVLFLCLLLSGLLSISVRAEAADCKDGWYPHEPYGPDSTCERWDLLVLKEGRPRWSGGDELRGNARFYAHQWGAMYI